MGGEAQDVLEVFKGKISECISMVGLMGPKDRISAVEIWNEISEKLQEVINHSVEEIDRLELEFSNKTEFETSCETNSLSTSISKEHTYNFVIKDEDKLPAGEDNNDESSPASKMPSSVVLSHIDGQTIILSSDLINCDTTQEQQEGNEEEEEEGEEEELVMTDLSGQVLIVSESEGLETGGDSLQHKVLQLAVSDLENNLEASDDVEEKITPEMASITTVTVDENPAPVDETRHKVSISKPDGSVETLYQCEVCNKTFSTAASLTSHRWQHTKPFQCEHDKCKARFASKGNLVIHRRRHTGDRPYDCNLCDAKFTTKGNLKRHIQSHSGVKPWACTQCDGRFTEKKSLKIHMRKHTGERPYVCKFCGKRFAQTSILKSHLAMHLDKRSHLCDLCGRSFRQKSQLRLHTQRHTGIRKFDCVYCESKFITKADLDRHVKSHLGTRDFACQLCSKSFTRQQTLNEHLNRHYGLKPFECKICRKTFSEMSTVYKHLKTHEKGEKIVEDQIIIHELPVAANINELTDVSNDLIDDVVINIGDKINNYINIENITETQN